MSKPKRRPCNPNHPKHRKLKLIDGTGLVEQRNREIEQRGVIKGLKMAERMLERTCGPYLPRIRARRRKLEKGGGR